MPSRSDDLFARLAAAENDAAALRSVLAEIAALTATAESFEFTHCIQLIAQSPALASAALGDWLITATRMDAARLLLQEMNISNLAGEQLVAFEPARLEAADAVLVGYRLAAFDAAPAVVLGWIVACFRADMDPNGKRLVALLSHEAQQYPGTTRRLLESLDPDLVARYPVLEEIRLAMTAAYAARVAAPRLKELMLSADDREVLRRHRLREQRDIHRQAEEASVLMKFIKRSHFKYASEVSLEFDVGGATSEQSLAMQEHELATELPFLAMTDPLRLLFLRRKLLEGQAP
ncbi:hypothetical protein [Stenotrophomonas sp. SAU14A_NAIMI4_8]|uniref:hypothetical protein n=1 Tax=Stenotrophomonas sp. SAU14A_NAIMI4_8 TaxID=2072409 RepID=UPI000D53DE6D|nr:hypothetical protein [Stenotrophomonas sp. SAU14A_NAIMI4_8]AWH31464.1 hypothetical protein C1930_00560 [Stenotrophomonas sp. SAU14A_NAIMI4_8]